MSEGHGCDPVWDRIFATQEWGKYPPEHVVRFVARNFYQAADRAKVRLLDLGSGPGANSWFMAREGFEVAAIDGAPTAIKRLEARLASEGLKADARVGNFVRLPWPDDSFDGIVDNAALCCNPLADARKVITEVLRVLKPGGLFCSANFTDRSWGYGVGRRAEAHGFNDITEGPLQGKGFALFLGRAEIDELYAEFADVAVDRLAYTVERGAHQIELWIVVARKRR